MPLTLTEKLDSRKRNTSESASVEMVYVLTGAADNVAAKDAVGPSWPVSFNG